MCLGSVYYSRSVFFSSINFAGIMLTWLVESDVRYGLKATKML